MVNAMAASRLTVRYVTQAAEWSRVAQPLWGYGYRQTWSYGQELARIRGAVDEYVLIGDGRRVIGATGVRVKHLPILGGGLAYVSGGPLLTLDPEDGAFASVLGHTIRALEAEYSRRRGCVLRVALPLVKEGQPALVEAVFRAAGFRLNEGRAFPYRTIRVDLAPPLDEIRTQLAQKWRNALNGALKQGLSVSVYDDAASLERFAALFDTFIARKGFAVDLGPQVYTRIQRALPPDERLVVQLAERDGELVAGHVSSMLGDSCVYLLGATSPAGLRAKAAYLLQWNTITLAKGRGLRWYDLGGIDPVGNPGVYHFKKGLGGEDITTPGPFEIAPRGWRAATVHGAEAAHQLLSRKVVLRSRAARGRAGGSGSISPEPQA